MDANLLKEFAQPSSPYRAKPFWAWNGKLDPQELRRQIRIFREMGMGGFFMHSRIGLDTTYLSKEWMDCTRECIDEARATGTEAWLYDEDRWPSGAAGGLVTKDERYRQRQLKMTRHEDVKTFKWAPQVLAAFTARLDGVIAHDVQPVARNKRPTLPTGHTLLSFQVALTDPNPWYNGFTYLDTLNPQAVRQFIKVTHEAYAREVGKDFGKLVPGIFTDEPCYGWPGKDLLPWTDKLPSVFRRRYGYDVANHFMELFFDVTGVEMSHARWNFYDCLTHLFVQSFARPIFEFCEANGIAFTGHIMCEDTLRVQSGYVGAAMRFYEFMQAPGMDLLTEHWRAYATAKQVTSVARQMGRKWRLTETNGCTGWDFSFEASKALGDWQAALGINLRCPHLSWYTMLGEAKRDYPASIFYQSPWWQQYQALENYFARITAVMTRGSEVRDLLVIHPIESVWTMVRPGWGSNPPADTLDLTFENDIRRLLGQQIDFDFGDEEMLSRLAKVRKAAGGKAPPQLLVGKAAYKAVLVPSMKTIRSSTLAMLEKFRQAGGLVVFAGETPTFVDAQASQAPGDFAKQGQHFASLNEEALATLASLARRLEVIDTRTNRPIEPVVTLLREDKDALYLLVVNTSHVPEAWGKDPLVRDRREAFEDVRVRLQTDAAGTPLELDPATGTVYAADARKAGDAWELRTSLPRIASRLFIVPKKAQKSLPARRATYQAVASTPLNPPAWDLLLDEDNVLVLDRPRYRIATGDWQGPLEILRTDGAVRDALKIARRGGGMVQPWAQDKTTKHKATPLTLEYEFDVRHRPTGAVRLAIEQPARYEIELNGQRVNADAASGWWTDRSLETIPLDVAVLRLGRNVLTLRTLYSQDHPGLEIVYLLGTFGSLADGTSVAVTPMPRQLQLGDWTTQGLTFYGGNVGYRTTIAPALADGQRLLVRLGEFRGVAVRVLVNGQPVGMIAWEPLELDITSAVQAAQSQAGAEVELVLEVLGHRRNSHGPLHHTHQWPYWTGPGEYVVTGEYWKDEFNLVPCGLMTPPQLVTVV